MKPVDLNDAGPPYGKMDVSAAQTQFGKHRATSGLLAIAVTAAFLSALAPAAKAQSRREAAAAAFQRAGRLRVQLETHPNRSAEDYLRVVHAFELVYRTDPGYPKTPSALAAAAEVYEEMGRQFASDRYYSKAIETYQFVAAQYPGGSLAVEALDAAAGIYLTDLENPVAARDAYEKLLQIYPRSQRAPAARAEVAKLNAKLARWPSGAAPRRSVRPASPILASRTSREESETTPQTTGAFQRAIQPVSGSKLTQSGATALNHGVLQEVESVHDWVGPNYTRIVIGAAGPVTFNALHLENPPRLVFDLAGARLSASLARKVFPVGNGFLKQVRIAQYSPSVTRVVLDVPQIEDYSVFSLPNPFRLVIDIHGAPGSPAARGRELASSRAGRSVNRLASSEPGGAAGRRSPSGIESGNSEVRAAADPFADSPTPFATRDAEAMGTNPRTARSQSDSSLPLPGSAGAAGQSAAGPLASDSSSAASPLVESPQGGLPAGAPTLTRALGLKIRRIVIDPGHGGHDTGTIGPTGLEEKNVVLDVGLRLRKLIERKMGCQVIMTRSTDTFIPLEERTAIANEYGADLFISIHANASRDPAARGVEVYYLNFTSDPEALEIAARENATSQESVYQLQSLIKKIALSEKIDESRDFAQIIDTRLEARLDAAGDPQRDRGVKKAPFVVLIGANMPSVLAEISFLTNPHDERLLRKPAFRQQIAQGLYNGIVRYASSLGTIRVAQASVARASRP